MYLLTTISSIVISSSSTNNLSVSAAQLTNKFLISESTKKNNK